MMSLRKKLAQFRLSKIVAVALPSLQKTFVAVARLLDNQ